MKMKITKMKGLVVALSMIGATTAINSQWLVSNTNDELYFGKFGTFTQSMGSMQNTVKSSIDQMAALNENKREQDLQTIQENDQRQREALGLANLANRNADIYPTLAGCLELTKRQIGTGAQTASQSGGSSGGTPGRKTPGGTPTTITSESTQQAIIIAQKQTVGTCSQMDVDANVAGCSSVGTYGGTGDIPSSDVSPLAIKGNTKKTDKLDQNSEFANYTLDQSAIDVANQMIINATLYNAPKALPKDKLKNNASYKSFYDAIMLKLNVAQQSLKDILAGRKGPKALASSSVASQYWTKNADTYQALMGMKQPAIPSLMDLLIFNTANDYSGIPSDTATNELDNLKRLNDRIALSNMIAIKQLAQQENTNILLTALLTQAVSPTNINDLNAQYNKIMTQPTAK